MAIFEVFLPYLFKLEPPFLYLYYIYYTFFRCLQWRKFNFFDLKKDIDDGKVSNALKVSVGLFRYRGPQHFLPTMNTLYFQDASIRCTTYGNNQIIVCDSYGCIHLFNRNWEASTFKGHDGSIELCELSRQHNLLITVGVSGM